MRPPAVPTVRPPGAPKRPLPTAASSAAAVSAAAAAAAASAVLLLISCTLTQNTREPAQPPQPAADQTQTVNTSPESPPAPPEPSGIETPSAPESPPPDTPPSQPPVVPSESASPGEPESAVASADSPADKQPSPLEEPPGKVNLFKRPPDSSAPPKNKPEKSKAPPQKVPKQTQPRKIRNFTPDELLPSPQNSLGAAPLTPPDNEPPAAEPPADGPPADEPPAAEPSPSEPRLTAPPINPLKEPDIPLESFTPSSDSPAPSREPPSPAPPAESAKIAPARPPVNPLQTPTTRPPVNPLLSPSQKPPASPVHPALSAEAPLRYLDEPGTFTITLSGQGWVFRSDLADAGPWVYLEREREGSSTRFNFRADREGAWNLVFDRQDLSGGGIERRVRRIQVGGSQAPPAAPDETPASRLASAQEAAAAGRFEEAFALWEEDAALSGPEGRSAREGIVREASQLGAMAPLVRWLKPYIEDGADPLVLQKVLQRLTGTLGYQEETIAVLEALLSGERRDEWLYRLAFHLEQPGDYRNIDRAAALYREIVESRTLSEWRERAEERISRLERHYYRVR